MTDDQSYRDFLREQRRHEELLDRYYQKLNDYFDEHPDASETEVMAYAELLEAAIPGLKKALRASWLEGKLTAALVRGRGDGLPFSGPCAERDAADGGRLWKQPEQWTLDDYRVSLAWHREPGAPAAQLAALIAYGESRWPGDDVSRGPWPDTSDLPAWQELAPYLTDDEDESEDPEPDR